MLKSIRMFSLFMGGVNFGMALSALTLFQTLPGLKTNIPIGIVCGTVGLIGGTIKISEKKKI